MVTTGQIVVLAVAILLFTAGGLISIARAWRNNESLRIGAKACLWSGVFVSLGVLVWHALARESGNWLPLDDNFEAFLWLAILLAIFVMYVQRTKPIGGLEWFVIPIVIVLLVSAGVFGKARPQAYVDTAWSWVHRITSYGGTLAFAIAGAVGAMYLIVSRRLRSKEGMAKALSSTNLGSLERLERITFSSVTLGFALLTVGLVAGLIWQLRMERVMEHTRLGDRWWASPKVVLATAVWVVYAIVLHARINPVLRGRKVAILSIVGCVLMVGTLIALNLMPSAAGGR
jgi:ABC-type transport system involved in cytochrome c biogenesis permease subunit